MNQTTQRAATHGGLGLLDQLLRDGVHEGHVTVSIDGDGGVADGLQRRR